MAARASHLWYLRKVNLLEDVDRDELERVARVLMLREIQRGELLMLTREAADRVYFLFKGRVGVSRIDPGSGKEVMLYLVRPGEPFGVLSHGRAGTESVARTLSKTLVGYVDKQEFLGIVESAGVRTRLEKLLESRLIKVENRLEELAFCDVPVRLARLLLRLSREFPGRCPEKSGDAIALRLTQAEIGNLIAASREITSLTLNEFLRDGLIVRHGRRLCLHGRAALEKMAG
jgi:CRP-like cAMP-binding protein